MKQNVIVLAIGFLLVLFGCERETRYTDKHGNIIIEKGDEISIIPAKFDKTGEFYNIFLLNKTDISVIIIDKFTLNPGEARTFKFTDTDSMVFDIGPKIYFGEYGLETEDKKGQLSGIGGDYWKKYNVPDDVEYGFVIVPPGEGDM